MIKLCNKCLVWYSVISNKSLFLPQPSSILSTYLHFINLSRGLSSKTFEPQLCCNSPCPLLNSDYMPDTMLNPLPAFPFLIFTNIHEVSIILIAHVFKKKKQQQQNKTKQPSVFKDV